ncbi:MAG: energy transducer TonB [Crocinitomicaceae bacterium]|nr:energy transducer TonB [Crocinitomicaceae bacterium]
MIAKKNSRYDLERKRIALLQVGLLMAGSFTLAAFSYKTDTVREQELAYENFEAIQYFEVPEEKPEEEPEVQEPVEVPPVQQPQQQQQSNQASSAVSQNTTVVQSQQNEPIATLGLPGVGPVDTAIIIVDGGDIEPFPLKEAAYVGGIAAMQKFIYDNVEYPEIDRMGNEQGRVYLSFIIEKDGSVSNVGIERGVTTTIDREASRVVRLFPKWEPGENAYGVVRTRVRLPINFTLGE